MALVRLRSPRGKVGVYHPDEYDIPKMLKAGFTRAGSVMVAAHERSHPMSVRQEKTFTPAETESAGITPETPQREEPWLVKNLPGAGGMAGDILGRAGGGTIGGALGGAASVPTAGTAAPATVPAGVVAGQNIGGPLGATAGGFVMEGLRQAIDHAIGIDAPDTPGEALQAMGAEGLTQGALSVGGWAMARGAKAVGRGTMAAALKSTPEVAQTAIREGITVTKAGAQKLAARMGHYGQQVLTMLRHSTAIGNRFDPQVFLNGAEGSLAKILEQDKYGNLAESRLPEAQAMLGKFQELSSDFLRKNASLGDMTPIELQKLKTEADAIARPLWKAINNGENLVPIDRAKAYWYKALGDHAREILEKTTPDMIDPATRKTVSLMEANARNRALIDLKEVMLPETKNSPGVVGKIVRRASVPLATGTAAAMIPGGNNKRDFALGASAGALGSSPEALSVLALLLSSPAVAATLRQVPRGVGAIGSEPRPSR